MDNLITFIMVFIIPLLQAGKFLIEKNDWELFTYFKDIEKYLSDVWPMIYVV